MTMRCRLRWAAPLAAAVAAAAMAAPAAADVTAAGDLRLATVGTFAAPTFVAAPPTDTRRVFVVQQGGPIRVVRDGAVLPVPFLTVPGVHDSGEQGLLSMAFAPDYATSGRFYVYYNDATACGGGGANCDVRIDEFRRAGGDEDRADPATRRTVLTIDHRKNSNHNGGQLQFGPDGLLYAGIGDGGGGGDTDGNAQNTNVLLGKLLRINPLASGGAGYQQPADNPFFGPAPGRDEIWAYGLRNPWRFSFDRLTGDLSIADVGQGAHEEVDFQPRGQGRGANYGWNLFEGFSRYPGGPSGTPPSYVPPVLDYDHSNGNCSITGGYISRDRTVARLAGRYLYGDYCVGQLRAVVLAPGASSQDGPIGLTVNGLASFGEDALCRVYVASNSGPVYRIESTTPAAAPGCTQAPPSRVGPAFSHVSMLRSRFAVGSGRTALSAVRRGTSFRYSLSEAATVQIRIQRKLPGRRVGSRCRAPSRSNRARPRCTRLRSVGTLTRRAGVGANKTSFTGRLGSRALAAGGYRAVLAATDADGNPARTRTLDFTVVAG
jgi:glucose/arabinose dehydrogenase